MRAAVLTAYNEPLEIEDLSDARLAVSVPNFKHELRRAAAV